MPHITRKTHPQARRLRQDATDAERKFWAAVRNRQAGGLKFRRQVSLGPYIADFACVEARLVIELDGGQHADAIEYDNRRTCYLESLGYRVVRFWNAEVLSNLDAVIATVLREAEGRTGSL